MVAISMTFLSVLTAGGESLLLGMANGSADVSIDMDSVQRNQQHTQIMQEQVRM